jgi:hypothetical protein
MNKARNPGNSERITFTVVFSDLIMRESSSSDRKTT